MPIVRLFILIGIFFWTGSVWAQAPRGSLSVENPRYEIRQLGKGEPWYDPLKGGRVRFTFAVKDILEGREHTFVLDNLSSEIKRLELSGDQLLVIGEEATSKAAVITIVGLKDGSIKDTLMGFWPALSPGDRYVVFRKFFSVSTADPPKKSDLVLLYDLERSAEENRVRGLEVYRNDPIGRLIESGRPVFPEANARRKRYRVWIRDEKKRHSILPGGFFWPDGERRIAFIDRVGPSFFLVVIDPRTPDKGPILHRGEFDPTEDEEGEPHILSGDRFRLKGVELLETGDLQIDLADREGEDQTWRFPPEAFEPPLFP